MDLGIDGRRALVCAASNGLGWACADALAREGVAVTLVGRDAGRLAAAADRIAERSAVRPSTQVADLSDVAQCTALIESQGVPDMLVTNCGGPPVGDAARWESGHWNDALQSLFLGPMALINACLPLMAERGFGRIVSVSSAAVLAPKRGFALSVSPRAALIAFMAMVARDVASRNVTLNSLLPGSIATERLNANLAHEAARERIDPSLAAHRRAESIPAGRLGTPEEFGACCAFLCSAHAGFVTGRCHLVDGGLIPQPF